MNVSTNNGRIKEIDICKAIGIALMIYAHRRDGFVHDYIYTFHMPLFFILSGMVIKKEALTFKQVVSKERKTLIEYIFFSFIIIIYCHFNNIYNMSFKEMVFDTISLNGIHVLWFLPSLMFARILFRSIDAKQLDIKKELIIFFVIYLLSTILYRVFSAKELYSIIIEFILTILRAMSLSIFIFIGYITKTKIFDDCYKINNLKSFLYSISILGIQLLFTKLGTYDYRLCKYPIIINIIIATLPSIAILLLLKMVVKHVPVISEKIAKVGQNSLYIMYSECFNLSLISYNLIYDNFSTTMNKLLYLFLYLVFMFIFVKALKMLNEHILKSA